MPWALNNCDNIFKANIIGYTLLPPIKDGLSMLHRARLASRSSERPSNACMKSAVELFTRLPNNLAPAEYDLRDSSSIPSGLSRKMNKWVPDRIAGHLPACLDTTCS